MIKDIREIVDILKHIKVSYSKPIVNIKLNAQCNSTEIRNKTRLSTLFRAIQYTTYLVLAKAVRSRRYKLGRKKLKNFYMWMV